MRVHEFELDERRTERRDKPLKPPESVGPNGVETVLGLQRGVGNAAVARALAERPTLARAGWWDSIKGTFGGGSDREDDLGGNQGVGPGGIPTNTNLPAEQEDDPGFGRNQDVGPGGIPTNTSLPSQEQANPDLGGNQGVGPGGIPTNTNLPAEQEDDL